MTRAIANLLLAVFSLGLITPAIDVNPESKFAACCRRDGKHHCAMTALNVPSTGGLALNTAREKCPLYARKNAPNPLDSSGRVEFSVQPGRAPNAIVRACLSPALLVLSSNFQRGPPVFS